MEESRVVILRRFTKTSGFLKLGAWTITGKSSWNRFCRLHFQPTHANRNLMFVTDKNLPSLKCLRTRARPLKRTLRTCSTHTHSHTHYTQIPSNSHKGLDFTRCCFFISVLYCTTLKHEKIPVVKERQQTTIMYIIYIFCLFYT